MSDKEAVHALRGDKQKQFGCMNGFFQIFDHRYLLGQRRHGHNHKRLPPGQSNNGETDLKNDKEKSPKGVTEEKTELTTSCQSVISEPSSSPLLHSKQPDLFMQSPDIRDVVKGSMTREPRVVSIKTVAKDERVGPTMKHVDSPRPSPHQNSIIYETTRFSCDGRESRYQIKSNIKIKELPRLSLDSRQGYNSNSAKGPLSNLRPSSSVVARLMGLEALTPSIDETKTSKTNSCLNKDSVLNSKSSRKEEELKHDRASISTRVHKSQRAVKVNHVFTRIPLETAPWKLERSGRGPRAKPGSLPIYDEIEKHLMTEHEFKTAGKDLRALKQILEAMQKTKKRLDIKEHALDNTSIDDRLTVQKVKHAEARQDPKVRDRKANSKPVSTSYFPECSGTMSPKMQRAKNGIIGPAPDLSRPKKQPGMQRTPLGSTNRHPKAKSIYPQQDSSNTRNLSQVSDTVSFQSNDSETMSTEWAQEINSPFQQKENHRDNIAEWLTKEKSTKHTMEQPSPVSVLDEFYTEDTPSPIKKKVTAFNDDENSQFEEAQDQARMNNLPNSTNLYQYPEFNKMKLVLNTNTDDETGDHRYVEEILLASGCLRDLEVTTIIAQLNPTTGFINPELFHVLEKTKTCTELIDDGCNKKFMRSKIRRKLVFDTVNDVLGYKLARLGPLGPHKGRILNADKLLKELCSGIDGLHDNSEIGVPDEDDEVKNIINADVNKRSQEWEEYDYQVPGLVLSIERLIFKDLICEVVNGEVTSLDWPVRPHCRRLFPM